MLEVRWYVKISVPYKIDPNITSGAWHYERCGLKLRSWPRNLNSIIISIISYPQRIPRGIFYDLHLQSRMIYDHHVQHWWPRIRPIETVLVHTTWRLLTSKWPDQDSIAISRQDRLEEWPSHSEAAQTCPHSGFVSESFEGSWSGGRLLRLDQGARP